MYVRFNMAFRDAVDRSHYGIRIGVAIPLRSPTEDGLPAEPEFTELAEIEEVLVSAASGHAVLVGVITTASMREFVLHASTSEWIADFDHTLQELVRSHEVQVMAQTDPRWETYFSFVPENA
jgi:hypothetical protein